MTALICGSAAYDNIMVFEDSFKNHILPDKIHMLNVAFLVPKLRREFGGCATNIAYNLKLLGETPLPMATVGSDFEPYRKRLKKLGIKQDYIRTLDDCFKSGLGVAPKRFILALRLNRVRQQLRQAGEGTTVTMYFPALPAIQRPGQIAPSAVAPAPVYRKTTPKTAAIAAIATR